MKYDVSFDKNRSYGIDYHLLAHELGKIIKEENILVLTDNIDYIKNTFDVRFCMVGDDEEIFRWTNVRKIPRIGEQVTDCTVSGKKLYDIKWYTVQEIFHLNEHIVACAVSPYKPLSPEQPDKPFKRI